VRTAINNGPELLIFAQRAAHSQITLDDLGDDDID
jgi:hypothetical protein